MLKTEKLVFSKKVLFKKFPLLISYAQKLLVYLNLAVDCRSYDFLTYSPMFLQDVQVVGQMRVHTATFAVNHSLRYDNELYLHLACFKIFVFEKQRPVSSLSSLFLCFSCYILCCRRWKYSTKLIVCVVLICKFQKKNLYGFLQVQDV